MGFNVGDRVRVEQFTHIHYTEEGIVVGYRESHLKNHYNMVKLDRFPAPEMFTDGCLELLGSLSLEELLTHENEVVRESAAGFVGSKKRY